MANSMIEGIKAQLKHGFVQAWKDLPAKDKLSIIQSLREFADQLEKDVKAELPDG